MHRIIIAEDEPLALARLARIIGKVAALDLVAQCADGIDAVEQINRLKPDIVVLDIQMPGYQGFEVLNYLTQTPKPVIIFTTAYEQYAIKAFEFCALDYLLKPYKDERLEKSLHRAIDELSKNQTSSNNDQKLQKLSQMGDNLPHFQVLVKGVEINVSAGDVQFIQAQGNYVQLVTANKSYLYRSTVSAMEYTLQDVHFLRIHRSCIINPQFLKKVSYLHHNNQFQFHLAAGECLVSGRSFKTRIAQWLENHPQYLT